MGCGIHRAAAPFRQYGLWAISFILIVINFGVILIRSSLAQYHDEGY